MKRVHEYKGVKFIIDNEKNYGIDGYLYKYTVYSLYNNHHSERIAVGNTLNEATLNAWQFISFGFRTIN